MYHTNENNNELNSKTFESNNKNNENPLRELSENEKNKIKEIKDKSKDGANFILLTSPLKNNSKELLYERPKSFGAERSTTKQYVEDPRLDEKESQNDQNLVMKQIVLDAPDWACPYESRENESAFYEKQNPFNPIPHDGNVEASCLVESRYTDSKVHSKAETNLVTTKQKMKNCVKDGIENLRIKMGIASNNTGGSELSELYTNSDSNVSFISSPCVKRNPIKKRIQDTPAVSVNKRPKLDNDSDSVNNESMNSEQDLDSAGATNGSDNVEISFTDRNFVKGRPATPRKYIVDSQPIYEHMEGEEISYHEVMGKTNVTEEFDENENQFLEFVHLNFTQWQEQTEIFNNQYQQLLERVILARLKFNQRVIALKKNLDLFAVDLENHGNEIKKKSNLLKEYCQKIVTEVDKRIGEDLLNTINENIVDITDKTNS